MTGDHEDTEPASARLVFVGGLHRSGTTLLADLLAAHPDVSALAHTDAWHDEGQFLQDVFPTADACGGPGHFAFGAGAHLTEDDAAHPAELRRRLLESWMPYWDLDRRLLVEKSPPNLLRFRYLQAVFPDACFVAIVRNPIAVSYATQPWANASITELIEHWLYAHEQFEQDRAHLRRLAFVRYEDLVRDVGGTLGGITERLGLARYVPTIEIKTDANTRYLRRWRHSRVARVHPRVVVHRARFARRLRRLDYGYRLGGSS
jgi:hypothetical protein